MAYSSRQNLPFFFTQNHESITNTQKPTALQIIILKMLAASKQDQKIEYNS